MAYLSQKEFLQAVVVLTREVGLQGLRDKLVRFNALVSRRNVKSAEALADQLYMLTSGLRKQVPGTYAFHGIWSETLREKLGEDGEGKLEELAKAVNECLDEKEEVVADKAAELDAALAAYAQALAEKVGPDVAYLDMLLKAVPAVAKLLREKGVPSTAAADAALPAPESPPTESEGGSA